ncbi:MAG: ATP-binding protein [Lentimicrobiaceae bacterium]|nr:ATP-binding protein [Lentimicrobiaceae bacterium]
MFERKIIRLLDDWAGKTQRKPLVLRGARQVGKTSAVTVFSKGFDQYAYLNLDRPEDRNLFENDLPFQVLLDRLFFLNRIEKNDGRTLIFIDEIQNSPRAVNLLRYFYEDTPKLYVIAAGSLLESVIDNQISFPVGRVEYLAMHPCSFDEYLKASGEDRALALLDQLPVPEYAQPRLDELFRQYAAVGGMPEVVASYIENRDLVKLGSIYDSLITAYLDDVEKYGRNTTLSHVIRHIIRSSFRFAGQRIKFEGFGNSNYRSREIGDSFRTLEKAMLLQLVYPAINTRLPMNVKYRIPKLQLLDTGLVNHMIGLQVELLGARSIEDSWKGKIAEHITGQELFASENSVLAKLNYWLRDVRNSQAEVDFVMSFQNLLIPVEVKSGSSGRLKSLHLFMEMAPHPWAVRICSGKMNLENVVTPAGKKYSLINVPFYLAGRIRNVLEYFTGNKPDSIPAGNRI